MNLPNRLKKLESEHPEEMSLEEIALITKARILSPKSAYTPAAIEDGERGLQFVRAVHAYYTNRHPQSVEQIRDLSENRLAGLSDEEVIRAFVWARWFYRNQFMPSAG